MLAGCAREPAGSPACAVPHPVAELALTRSAGVPVAAAKVNGQPVHLIVDLGGQLSFLNEYAAAALGVRRTPVDIKLMVGAGGFTRRLAAVADRLELGALVRENQRFEVADGALADPRAPVQGLLGLDILRKYDVDLDLPHRRLILNAPANCEAPPPGWAASAMRVPISTPVPGNDLMTIPAMLDGRPVTALLDSGFTATTVGAEAARVAGFQAAAGATGIMAQGVDGGAVRDVQHRFRSLAAAGDTIADPVLLVGPVGQYFDMVLGADFLMRHRIWLAAGADAVWFAPFEDKAGVQP